MALPGMGGMGGMGGRGAGLDPQQMQEQQMVKYMQMAMESCPVKSVIAGGMGFGLGGMFGLFMSAMRYDTPLSAGMPGGVGVPNSALATLSTREQLKLGFKDMGRSSWSSAKNFGYIGAIFSGTECAIEGFRAKSDWKNGVAGGCLTGGWLAKSAGPQAMVVGCGGFAAFSAAIDYYMHLPDDDRAADPII